MTSTTRLILLSCIMAAASVHAKPPTIPSAHSREWNSLAFRHLNPGSVLGPAANYSDTDVLDVDGTRILTFVNRCNQKVRLGFTGGALGPCINGQCPAGQVCNTLEPQPHCFWDLPKPVEGKWDMDPNEQFHVRLEAPAVKGIKWSGNIFFSTHCQNVTVGPTTVTACATGICDKGTCAAYGGPAGPHTMAEVTLQTSNVDFYDVSVINGVNVGMSFGPSPGQSCPPASTFGIHGVATDYYCATAGGRSQPSSSSLSDCSWEFDETKAGPAGTDPKYLRFVSIAQPGEIPQSCQPCSSSADCSNGEVCGVAMKLNPFGEPTASTCVSCGRQVGYWTADEVCVTTAADPFGAPFNCRAAVGQGNGPDELSALYGCSGSDYSRSCYSKGAVDTCCGCPKWEDMGVKAPAAASCVNTNPAWTKLSQPWLVFLKQGCPSAYTFPYDDESSTFVASSSPTVNQLNYTIEVTCPSM